MILDADKEGYLRSETSLIQTAGRAARHVNGEVILFADTVTRSMKRMMEVTEYRRARQIAYNKEHGIEPTTVKRAIQESLQTIFGRAGGGDPIGGESGIGLGEDRDVLEVIRELTEEMLEASKKLEFEKAALLRDQIEELKASAPSGEKAEKKTVYRAKRQSRKASVR